MPRDCRSFRVEVEDGFFLNAYHWKAESQDGSDSKNTDGKNTRGPLLFVHATGFHARVWNQVIEKITDRDIYAVDSPGHGLSDRFSPPFTWQQFADRIQKFIEKTGLTNITGVGHSMGGHLLVLIAAELQVFERLLLLDPIILSPEALEMSGRLQEMGIKEHPTAKRRNQWASPEEMVDRFSTREPFCDWKPEVLKDYCDWGLVPAGDGFELACPPEIESAIYLSSGGEQVYDKIPKVNIPVQIVRGRPRTPEDNPLDFRPSPTRPDLDSVFRNAKDRVLADYTHFFPFEEPQLVVDLIENDCS